MRKNRRKLLVVVNKAAEERLSSYSRQVEYSDPFDRIYEKNTKIKKPPYDIAKLYELVEESGVVGACIDAYVSNICGFGYMIAPVKKTSYDLTEEEQNQKTMLEEIFKHPNPFESFSTIQERVLFDREACGNGFIEVIRDTSGKPSMLFWADAKRVRIADVDKEPVEIEASIIRRGRLVKVKTLKQFKRFVMLNSNGELRYFKEYGDPRLVNALTGETVDKKKLPKDFIPASELIHFKIGTGTYGVPRWAKIIKTALGINLAEFINYDLFDSQGIPPCIVSVEGGELTEESLEDLYNLFQSAKGAKNFNKVLLLEAISTTTTLEGKEAVPKIKIEDLTSYRKEDVLFEKYMTHAEQYIRKIGFRLPELFLGATENLNYATAKISRETAEEQVFIPERRKFDEVINNTIIKDLGITSLEFVTRNPVIKSAEDVIRILPQLIKAGPFSMNELIEYANKNFGLNLEPYDEDWADLPVPLLVNLFQGIGMALGSKISREGLESLPPNALGGLRTSLEPANQWTEDITRETPEE